MSDQQNTEMNETTLNLSSHLMQVRNELKNIRAHQRKLQTMLSHDKKLILDQLQQCSSELNDRIQTEHHVLNDQHLFTSDLSDEKHDKATCCMSASDLSDQKHDRAARCMSVEKASKQTSAHAINTTSSDLAAYSLKTIGHIESMYTHKNGTPRQPGICREGSTRLIISKSQFNNPQHSLIGLEQFSHIWILFIFHKNNNSYAGAKICPPRLNGSKVGVFASRSPYRPNPIGLSLAKIDRIEGNVIYFFGALDLLNGTPVIDIKPYIPQYDMVSRLIDVSEVVTSECEMDSREKKSMTTAAFSNIGPSMQTVNQSDDLYHPSMSRDECVSQSDGLLQSSSNTIDREDADCAEVAQKTVGRNYLIDFNAGKDVDVSQNSSVLYDRSDDLTEMLPLPQSSNPQLNEYISLPFISSQSVISPMISSQSLDSSLISSFSVDEVRVADWITRQQNSSSISLPDATASISATEATTSISATHATVSISSTEATAGNSAADATFDTGTNTMTTGSTPLRGSSLLTTVLITPRAEQQLKRFTRSQHNISRETSYHLEHLNDAHEAWRAISSILLADPRSIYRRNMCADRLYYFTVDNIQVTCWFDDCIVEVLTVKPIVS